LNFELLADGPNRPLLDFAMARNGGDLVQRRVQPLRACPLGTFREMARPNFDTLYSLA
jgi:hypothetical protein